MVYKYVINFSNKIMVCAVVCIGSKTGVKKFE